jgi:hypothetical protein
MTTKKDEIINQLLDKIDELIKGQKEISAYEQHDNDFYDYKREGL